MAKKMIRKTRKPVIATPGESPAMITETLGLLTEQEIRPDGVLLFHSEDPDGKEHPDLLAWQLWTYCSISDVKPVSGGLCEDIDSVKAGSEFMKLLALNSKPTAKIVFTSSITEGRNAVYAPLVLAMQFYGVERLCHIRVAILTEEEDKIRCLKRQSEESSTMKS